MAMGKENSAIWQFQFDAVGFFFISVAGGDVTDVAFVRIIVRRQE